MPELTVALVNLGCPKNLVDAERILGVFAERGWVICSEPAQASLVLVNTCGFIEAAREESLNALLETVSLKNSGIVHAVVAIGCLIERYRDELAVQIPAVDAWVGLVEPCALERFCRNLLQGHTLPECLLPHKDPRTAELARLRLTPRSHAWLRIAEGCDNRCHYCVIPSIRGPYVSKPMESILAEARELAADGAVELNLMAQDTTRYGTDLYGRPMLARLIRELARVEQVRWIRLLYTHPAHFDESLVEVLATEPKMCHYVDVPIQHINDTILERMGRKVSRAQIERLIERLRSAVPDIALRTSIIVGFPGETEAQFKELLAFVRQARFDRLGAFAYSREEGTPASLYPDQHSREEKERRLRTLMDLQKEISLEVNRGRIGCKLAMLVEGRTSASRWKGRTQYDAPEIDGLLFVKAAALVPHQFCAVNVTATRGYYDLEGVLA